MNNLDFQKYESVFDRCQTVNVEFATDVIERSEEQTRLLWPPFWNEGEITVLFAESNVGKSIVAMQVARDIARGRSSISDFEAEPTSSFATDTRAASSPTNFFVARKKKICRNS